MKSFTKEEAVAFLATKGYTLNEILYISYLSPDNRHKFKVITTAGGLMHVDLDEETINFQ